MWEKQWHLIILIYGTLFVWLGWVEFSVSFEDGGSDLTFVTIKVTLLMSDQMRWVFHSQVKSCWTVPILKVDYDERWHTEELK